MTDALIFQVLRNTYVVERESFTLATFNPGTGTITGRISAQDFADQLIRTLGLCRQHALTECTVCEPDEDEDEDE